MSAFVFDIVLDQKRRLRQRKEENQGHNAPPLEQDPVRGGGVAPHRLIQHRQGQKENSPAPGEASPTFFRQFKGLSEDIFYEKVIERQPDQQRRAEDRIKDGDLHLDEGVIVQIEGQAAKDHHQNGGDEGNGGEFFLKMPADHQR